MEPFCHFQHLDIRKCWPTSDKDFVRYAAQVTPRGRPGAVAPGTLPHASPRLVSVYELGSPNLRPEVGVVPQGVLQVCLLSMAFFQGCRDREIRDSRIPLDHHAQRLFDCPKRPLLIEALADALLKYEGDCCKITQHLQRQPADKQQALEVVIQACYVYVTLHRRRSLASTPVLPADVDMSLRNINSVIEVLTPEHYKLAMGIRTLALKNQLFIAMRAAFTKYGPDPRKHPMVSVDHSIAVILCHLSIEEGTDFKRIVERLRKRFKDEERREMRQ